MHYDKIPGYHPEKPPNSSGIAQCRLLHFFVEYVSIQAYADSDFCGIRSMHTCTQAENTCVV